MIRNHIAEQMEAHKRQVEFDERWEILKTKAQDRIRAGMSAEDAIDLMAREMPEAVRA